MSITYHEFTRICEEHAGTQIDARVRFHESGPVPTVVHEGSCRHKWSEWSDCRPYWSLTELRRDIEAYTAERGLYLFANNLTPGCCGGPLTGLIGPG